MKLAPNIYTLAAIKVSVMNAASQRQILAIKRYLAIRNYKYTSYTSIMLSQQNHGGIVKRLFLDGEGQLAQGKNKPIAVVYLLDNQAATYVSLSNSLKSTLVLGKTAIQNLPSTVQE